MKRRRRKRRIGLFLNFGEVTGGGGVERFYLHIARIANEETDYEIITDKPSVNNILAIAPDFPLKKVKAFPVFNRSLDLLIAQIYIRFLIILRSYSIVHIANYNSYYDRLLRFIARYSHASLNLIDCRLPYQIEEDKFYNLRNFLSSAPLSGILSWYENNRSLVERFNRTARFKAVNYCFTDTTRFRPTRKEKIIVWAARVTETKRPLLFIDVVHWIYQHHPNSLIGWEIYLAGNGDLYDMVKRYIEQKRLGAIINIGFTPDLSSLLNRSTIFISTQMYENFTSLSMLEAMAAGNAIVAFNVGQTERFVRHMKNGELVDKETAECMGSTLTSLMASSDTLSSYGLQSLEIVRKEHNQQNFVAELNDYWDSIAPSR